MILLDTDHLTILYYTEHPRTASLKAAISVSADPRVVVSVVSIEEQFRGWMTEVARHRDVHKQIAAYDRLIALLDLLKSWEVVPFDDRSADEFKKLRQQRVRIGTQDLKIAAIALANDALLLSANLREFRAVPQLRVENWLE